MKRTTFQSQIAILIMALCLALSPIAMQLHAQTPGAEPPPPPAAEVPPPPPAEDPPPPPAEEPPPPPAEDPPPPPAEDPPPPPAEEPPPPPADEPPPPAEEPPPPPAEEPPPPTDDPGDSPDDGSIVEEPSEEATDEPTTESTEEPTTEATDESTSEATEEVTDSAEADGDSTPDAEVEGESDEDSTPATPTPTEEVIVPDELQVVGEGNITINPGEHRDVVVRYTLGSDREKTEMSANLTAPGGESLDDWSLVPWQRADLDEDPQDANRELKARIDYADTVENGDVYETTWRVTAPDHIEKPVTVRMHVNTKIHRVDGVTDGVIKNDLVSINAVASEHNPTLTCDEVIAEDVDNTWNCAFNTTHPDDDLVITASAELPEGWELALDGVELTSEPMALSAEAIASDSFTITATYPIGCPDIGAIFSTSVSLSMTYPSGDVKALDQQLALQFVEPHASMTVNSVNFGTIDDMEELSASGQLVLSFENAPCGLDGVITFGELSLNDTVVEGTKISLVEISGPEGVNAALIDNKLAVKVPESVTTNNSGSISLVLKLDLPHLVMPGSYVLAIYTELVSEGSQ